MYTIFDEIDLIVKTKVLGSRPTDSLQLAAKQTFGGSAGKHELDRQQQHETSCARTHSREHSLNGKRLISNVGAQMRT